MLPWFASNYNGFQNLGPHDSSCGIQCERRLSGEELPASALNTKVIQVVEKRGLTHAQVAALAGTSRTRITALINRNTKDVSTDLMLRVLGALAALGRRLSHRNVRLHERAALRARARCVLGKARAEAAGPRKYLSEQIVGSELEGRTLRCPRSARRCRNQSARRGRVVSRGYEYGLVRVRARRTRPVTIGCRSRGAPASSVSPAIHLRWRKCVESPA